MGLFIQKNTGQEEIWTGVQSSHSARQRGLLLLHQQQTRLQSGGAHCSGSNSLRWKLDFRDDKKQSRIEVTTRLGFGLYIHHHSNGPKHPPFLQTYLINPI